MELRVRNVDPICIKKIDELAKRKGISRSRFLKNLIENFCDRATISQYKKEMDETTAALKLAVEKNTQTLERFMKIFSATESDFNGSVYSKR